MIKYILLWIPMPVLAIINGTIRQVFLLKPFGDKAAHQLSTATLLIILGLYIWPVLSKWPPKDSGQAVVTGVLWFILTVAFEFLLSMVMLKKNLTQTLQAYNIFKGELWPLILLFVLIAPVLIYKLKN